MTSPARYPDQILYAGDTKQWAMVFRNAAGTALDLSAITWSCQIRRSKLTSAGTPGTPLATVSIVTTDAATGKLVLTLTSTESAKLRVVDRAYWDLEGTTGSQVLTYFYGNLKILKDVTE